jgi:hypothetical protein
MLYQQFYCHYVKEKYPLIATQYDAILNSSMFSVGQLNITIIDYRMVTGGLITGITLTM